MSTDAKIRELKGKAIAGLKDSVSRIKENLYKVKSQTGNGQEYDVTFNNEKWITLVLHPIQQFSLEILR